MRGQLSGGHDHSRSGAESEALDDPAQQRGGTRAGQAAVPEAVGDRIRDAPRVASDDGWQGARHLEHPQRVAPAKGATMAERHEDRMHPRMAATGEQMQAAQYDGILRPLVRRFVEVAKVADLFEGLGVGTEVAVEDA